MGQPAIETFSSSETHAGGFFLSMAQDGKSGRLYAGTASGVLSFDGRLWRAITPSGSLEYRCLALDAAGSRLWFGSPNNLGYLELSDVGEAKLVSLRDRLPFPASELVNIWACQVRQGSVDFVAQDRVFRWDGEKFTVWKYPTQARLFPVKFEGNLWFHHLETGLYRLGPKGPETITPASSMPTAGIFLLHREEGQLLGVSNQGLQVLSPTPRLVSPPETNQFLAQGKVTAATHLSRGQILITTLESGSAILDASGRLLKIINEADGFTAAGFGHFVDHDQALWIFNGQSISRIQTPGSVARISSSPNTAAELIDSLVVENDTSVWYCADRKLIHAQLDSRGLTLRQQPIGKRHIKYALNTSHGVMLGGQRELQLLQGQQVITLAELPSSDISHIAASRWSPDRYFLLTRVDFAEVQRTPQNQWNVKRYPDLATATANATSLAEDEAGGIWIGTQTHGATYLQPNGNGFVVATPTGLAEKFPGSSSTVFRRPHDTLLEIDGALLSVATGREPQSLNFHLPERTFAGAISADGQRLYCLQHHLGAPTTYSNSIFVVDFTPDGAVRQTRSLIIPSLSSIGDISKLGVSSERGTDTLWIGGASGLLQVRVEEMPIWAAPQPPRIALLSDNQPAGHNLFPSQHQLHFQLRTQELSLSPALRFQTRLGDSDSPWSTTTDRTDFEFSNLREGTYLFSARTINPVGKTSAPVNYTFTIQPPWYRTPWAYTGYLALVGLGIFAIMRYREIRIQARADLLEKTVAERTAELVKANAAKDEFLASMSHEIRNPMNGVVGLSAAIDTSHLNHEGRHRFDLLRHCAAHLASLLEDILDFSKLQAGTVELDPQPFAMTELLDAVAAITSAASAEAESPLELALGPTVPPRLIGDARRIRQILLNYVTNALKYAPHSQVDLTVWARPAQENSVRVTFAVTDQGPGIPASEHERIFEKFERGVGARLNRIPGTGMGLAVCRKLAVAMGGRAWCESTPGEGSTFFLELTLPLATNAPIVSSSPDILDRAPRLALVVDDEEYNLIALSSHLSGLGYEVTPAADAATAIEQVSAQDFHSIFLDYEMPELKGPQLARHIRQICAANGRQPLIFATTAYTTADKRAECLAAGMDGFLGKPVEPGKLRRLLAEHEEQNPAAPLEATPEIVVVDPLDNLRRMARQKSTTLSAEFSEFCEATAAEFAEFDAGQLARDSARCARSAHRLTGRLGFVTAQNAAATAHTLQNVCQAEDWISVARLRADTERLWRIHHDTLNRLTSTPSV